MSHLVPTLFKVIFSNIKIVFYDLITYYIKACSKQDLNLFKPVVLLKV